MIRSFRCRETSRVWAGEVSRKFPGDIQQRALVKLRQLDASVSLSDLKNPPGNNLKPLKGDMAGRMSIRINEQWRICFTWKGADAHDVEILDYH